MQAVKRGLNIAGNILFVVFIVFMISVLAFMFKAKIDGGVPSVGPYSLYIVLSGSMNPTFDTGSLLAVQKVDPVSIKAGDIITFKNSEDQSLIVTHRVVEIKNENGSLVYITRGDANDAPDLETVSPANIIGRVAYWVPYAGYVTDFAKSKNGLILMIVLPCLVIMIGELRKLVGYAQEMDELNSGNIDAEKGLRL